MRWLSEAVVDVAWEECLTSVLFQATLITLVAAMMILRLKPAIRHTVLFGVLLALLACPILVSGSRIFDLQLEVPLLAAGVSTEATDNDYAEERIHSDDLMPRASELSTRVHHETKTPLVASAESISALDRSVASDLAVEQNAMRPPITWRTFGLAILFLIWFLGFLACMARLVWGMWWVRRLVRSSSPVPSESANIRIDSKVLVKLLGTKALPKILESDQLQVPIVTNFFHPVIVLPKGSMCQLSTGELTSLLSHEVAHVRRGDCFVGILQRVVGALYWFHPVVHWLNRQLNISREEICDNYVLAVTPPADYASLLLKIGEQATLPRYTTAMPLLSPAWKLEDRIKGLLDPNRDRLTQASASTRLLVTLILAVVVGFLSSARVVSYAKEKGSASIASITDLYGDTIPYGGKVRIGTERFRPACEDWNSLITFSKESRSIVEVTTDGHVSWYDARTGKRQKAVKYGLNTVCFAVAPDKSTFALTYLNFIESEATHEYGIQIRNLSTGDLVGDIALEDPSNDAKLLYTPDGRNIIYASDQAKIRIFDVEQQEELLDYQLPEQRRFDSIAVSPDGSQIVAACAKKLFFWNWLEDEAPEAVEGYEYLSCITFTPDGKSLALAYGHGKEVIEILDLKTRKTLQEFADPVMKSFYTNSIQFSSDGKLLIVPNSMSLGKGNRDNSVLVWELQSGKLIHRLQSDSVPRMVTISSDDQLIAAASKGVIVVWNLQNGERLAGDLRSHSAAISEIQFTTDGQRIVTASDDQTARLWNSSNGQQLGRLDCDMWVRAVVVSPDDKWIVTSSLDDTVCLWDATTLKKIYQLAGHGPQGGYRTVTFTPDSSRFTSFGDDSYLRVWDVATGKALLEEEIKPGGNALQDEDSFGDFGYGGFENSGKGILSVDASRLLIMKHDASYLYNASNGKELKKISMKIESACFSPDGGSLLLARASVGPTETRLKEGGVWHAGPKKYEAVLLDLGEETEKWAFEIEGRFGSIGFSPDGRLIALCKRGRTNDAIYLLDATSGKELAKIDAIEKLLWDSSDSKLAFSPDGQRLAVALMNTTAIVWDLKEMGVWK